MDAKGHGTRIANGAQNRPRVGLNVASNRLNASSDSTPDSESKAESNSTTVAADATLGRNAKIFASDFTTLNGRLSALRVELRARLWSVFHRKMSEKAKRKLLKYKKVFSLEKEKLDKKTVFVAKFDPTKADVITVALLSASDSTAAALFLLCRLLPGTILILLIIVVSAESGLPGIKFLSNASVLEVTVIALTIGLYITIKAIGPFSRPFATVPRVVRMRYLLQKEAEDTRWRLWIAAAAITLQHITTIFVIVSSAVVSMLSAVRVVALVWTALSLSWLQSLEQELVNEIIYRFYRHSTIAVAITDLQWSDADSRKQFWRKSWTSKEEIRAGLIDLSKDAWYKLNLITNSDKGLGLGSGHEGSPTSMSMELLLIKWSSLDQETIEEMGEIAARSVQKWEWVYHMSPVQRRLFFKYYPVLAAAMPWRGIIFLDTGQYTDSHLAAVAQILVNPENRIDELFLNSNSISDDGVLLLSNAAIQNQHLKRLWLFDNAFADSGGSAIAKLIRESKSLTSIHLRGNRLGDRSAIQIAESLRQNSVLKVLTLDNNEIGEDGAVALSNALEQNTTVRQLWLSDNNFDSMKLDKLVREKNLYNRVMIDPDCLSPVTQHIVRTKLEDMKLEPKARRLARAYLKSWALALNNQEKKDPQMKNMGSLLDVDLKKSDVRSIVDDITRRIADRPENKNRQHYLLRDTGARRNLVSDVQVMVDRVESQDETGLRDGMFRQPQYEPGDRQSRDSVGLAEIKELEGEVKYQGKNF